MVEVLGETELADDEVDGFQSDQRWEDVDVDVDDTSAGADDVLGIDQSTQVYPSEQDEDSDEDVVGLVVLAGMEEVVDDQSAQV